MPQVVEMTATVASGAASKQLISFSCFGLNSRSFLLPESAIMRHSLPPGDSPAARLCDATNGKGPTRKDERKKVCSYRHPFPVRGPAFLVRGAPLIFNQLQEHARIAPVPEEIAAMVTHPDRILTIANSMHTAAARRESA